MKESPWGPNPAWGDPKKNGHKSGQKKPDPRVAAREGEGESCMVVAVPVVVGIGLTLWSRGHVKTLWKLRRR